MKRSEKKINLKSFFHLSTFNDVERELPGLKTQQTIFDTSSSMQLTWEYSQIKLEICIFME